MTLCCARPRTGIEGAAGEQPMPGELARPVPDRALDAEPTAHPSDERPERAGHNTGSSGPAAWSSAGTGTTGPGRDIGYRREQDYYGARLPAEQVSRITGQVMDEFRAWQRRPLDPVWTVVFLDPIVVTVRAKHVVQVKLAYVGLGVDADGEEHVLGIWLASTPPKTATAREAVRFWASVTADLRNRGVRDILVACCDGLGGFEGAIHAAFPDAAVLGRRCGHGEAAQTPRPAGNGVTAPTEGVS